MDMHIFTLQMLPRFKYLVSKEKPLTGLVLVLLEYYFLPVAV